MLRTILDFDIFRDFLQNKPKDIIEGGKQDDIDFWNNLWSFFYSNSILTLVNVPEIDKLKGKEIDYLTLFNAKYSVNNSMEWNEKFSHPKKFIIPKRYHHQSVFFLADTIECHEKYERNNGFLFAFQKNYRKIWEDLSFIKRTTTLHIRKVATVDKMFSWNRFEQNLLPFTDVVLVDQFVFKVKSKIKQNYGNLLKSLITNTHLPFSLLIITNIRDDVDRYFTDKDNKRLSIKESIENIWRYLDENNLIPKKVNLSIVHSSKEHDRNIYFKYFYCELGTSLGFSDSNAKEGLTGKRSKVRFFPYTDPDHSEDSRQIIIDLHKIVQESDEMVSKGNKKNRLLMPD